MDFTAPDLYGFNGRAFFHAVCGLLSIDPPDEDEVAQRVLSAPGDQWARESAHRALATEAFIAAGVSPSAAKRLSWANHYPIEPEELVATLQGIPLPSGLVALRVRYARVGDDYSEHKDVIAAGNFTFDFKESSFEPEGDDRALVASMAAGDADIVAKLLATSVAGAIRSNSEEGQSSLLERVARELLNLSKRGPTPC